MGIRAKKLLLIGIDQAIPYLLNKFLNEGILPNINYLVDNGVLGEAYSSAPCDTPTNWATIATGATCAVHGATSFYMHQPGEPLDFGLKYRSRTQLSKYCNAEYFWDVADRNGMIPFVINYPAGWYSIFRKGAMCVFTWNIPDSLPRILIGSEVQVFSIESKIPNEKLIPVNKSIENINSTSLVFKAVIEIMGTEIKTPFSFEIFLFSSNGDNYDSIYIPILQGKNQQVIRKNYRSDWIQIQLDTIYGKLPCLLYIKILNIDPKGNFLEIKRSAVYNTKGWSFPEEFGRDLVINAFGIDLPPKQKVEFMIYGKFSKYIRTARQESLTLARAINYSKQAINWDICYFHYHPLDTINHDSLAFLYKESPIYDEKKAEKTWENVRIAYKIVDEMVGSLLKSCVDKNTVIVFVSDHGAVPVWKMVNISKAFKEAGLLSYKWDSSKKKYLIDWKHSLAFPYMEPPFVWINFEGRDPHGIVKKTECESVKQRIIETLYNIRDPETDEEIVELALRREDSTELGLNGERVGDIIYFLKPPYGIFDGNFDTINASYISQELLNKPLIYGARFFFGAHAYFLPTAKFGKYSISAPVIISGPGIKKGFKLKKAVNLIDLAPTLANILDLPHPKNSQGRILNEIFD
ncbi:MAG: alkaline phosphatase family protein [Candidatus Thorarchaeota archaeon]